jgi:2-oxoglutarate dehydrogenase E1 component
LGPSFKARSVFNPLPASGSNATLANPSTRTAGLHDRLNEMIRSYRVRGHIAAAVDPLGSSRFPPPELDLDYYAFTSSELRLLTDSNLLPYDEPLTVMEIFERLRKAYCGSIGVQYMHIDDGATRRWMQLRVEGNLNRRALGRQEQLRILTRLTDAVMFEQFLRKKFVGAKTFSLEGSETLLPLLDLAIEKAGEQGVTQIVFGMAHRGRLNVLANIIGKPASEIFREFADKDPAQWQGRGDVKYHLGHSGEWTTASGRNLHLSLCFNPSHLEFVNPVVMGRVRARQDRLGDLQRRQVLGVILHGDAALAGEGVVQETLNFSTLPGYAIGGVLHVVINNQIGFTTLPDEGRSTVYATDVARMLQVPIFHVNGEDPEAVAQVVHLAMDFRREFQRDVFIDMYGYRRQGHNEVDEPSFTQPDLYRAIARRPDVRQSYLEHLLKLDGITDSEAKGIAAARLDMLEEQLKASQNVAPGESQERRGIWRDYSGGPEPAGEPDTGVPAPQLESLLQGLTNLPAAFRLHPKLERFMTARREMAAGRQPLDWSTAEALALASLAAQGVRIRLTGQDTARGTFSQRHAILHDYEDGSPFIPLQHVAGSQGPVEIRNSPLSEIAALGFEYGYSLDCPEGLILWEAQFGDFANAAQVVIDQFIASAEDKWRRLSGLVLLLPHGFEGMGPEHSSARVERFLQLAAEDNIQIAEPTTPAQYFHLLRRQALNHWRKPMVIFTPKGLLRHPRVVSSLSDCAQGRFQRLLPDPSSPTTTTRVLLTSGRTFYELAAFRDEHHRADVALLRIEQLYPLRAESLETALAPYPDGTPLFWVQQEPENMGAWRYLRGRFGETLLGRFPWRHISRLESASPATGSHGAHELEQQDLNRRAFDMEAAALSPKP